MKTKICRVLPVIMFLTAILVMMPGVQREGSSQQMMPGVHVRGQMVHSMGMMSEIMKDMDQMRREGRMTPEQQQEISDMMNQMGYMMRQMSTTQPRHVEEDQHRKLKKMQERLKILKRQVQKQKKVQGQPGPQPQQ